jgi:hypothetical protein
MFINYSCHQGKLWISNDPIYIPSADVSLYSVKDIVIAMLCGESSSCPLKGALDALEDGSLWEDTTANTEILEDVHSLILDYEKGV